ncbi:MHC class I alpha chain, partial [Clarias magur]
THSLQYIYTAVTPGINFPEFTIVGQVDGEQLNYYDSKISRMIRKTEWIQKNDAEDPEYWNRNTQTAQGSQETFKVNLFTAMQRFNHDTGVHTVQLMYGCELDDDGTTRGYTQYGYDGEDFISFDLKTRTWIAPTPQAVITKYKWDLNYSLNNNWRNYLENTCIDWLKKYLSYGRETLERKVRPKVSVFQRHSCPSPEVVCHATGFFPKAVMITWQKDGEDVHEDVELRETLPNQDGSFQKRSILKVPAERLQKHTYTCVVQHSSLEKELGREVPKERTHSITVDEDDDEETTSAVDNAGRSTELPAKELNKVHLQKQIRISDMEMDLIRLQMEEKRLSIKKATLEIELLEHRLK